MRTQAARNPACSTPILVTAAAVAIAFGCGPHLAAGHSTSHSQAHPKVVAIAPLANDSNNPEGVAAGQAVREAIFRELIRRRGKYTVTVQDIAETDRRLRDAAIPDSSAARLPVIDLCRMIGANAVMKGSVTRYLKVGAGNAFSRASDALFGLVTSEVSVEVAIFDGTDGRLLFSHSVEKSGDLVHERDALLNKVGSALAKKFPYRR